jgi:hypothetical protein
MPEEGRLGRLTISSKLSGLEGAAIGPSTVLFSNILVILLLFGRSERDPTPSPPKPAGPE